MKKTNVLILILSVLMFTMSSCKKKEEQPVANFSPTPSEVNIRVGDKVTFTSSSVNDDSQQWFVNGSDYNIGKTFWQEPLYPGNLTIGLRVYSKSRKKEDYKEYTYMVKDACNYTTYSGSDSHCSGTDVAVTYNVCCPASAPYYCATFPGGCYATCEDAESRSGGCTNIVLGTTEGGVGSICLVGKWTKTECGQVAIETFVEGTPNTAVLNDWSCDGTINRIVKWEWTVSTGSYHMKYTSFTFNGPPEITPLPAEEDVSYTCSGDILVAGGVTWTRVP